ncbi:MAG: outer membrane beta-barrel protein [Bacteroidales bacterium]|nr:MAG: outer membrane beta-barrel protein [Bacteroidales bacterium]
MKTLSVLIIIIVAFNLKGLKAQTEQGKFLVGVSSTLNIAGIRGGELMSLGFTSSKYKSDAAGFEEREPYKTTGINMSPKVGYFLIDNLVFYLDLNVTYSSGKDGEDEDKWITTIFCAGPYARYYIPANNVSIFLEAGGAFGSYKDKYEPATGDSDVDKTAIMNFGGGLGIAAPLGERITLDVLAGYNSLTFKDKEDNEDNNRYVSGTFGIKLGFTILL